MFDLPTLQQTQQQLPLYQHQLPPPPEHAQGEPVQRQLSSTFDFDFDNNNSGYDEYEYDYQTREFQDPLVPPPRPLQQPDLGQYMTLEMNGMQLQVPRADASFLHVPSAAPAIVGHERDGGGCMLNQSDGVSGGGMGNGNDNVNANANADTGVVGWSFDTFINMVPPPAQPVASASSTTAASASAPMMTMTMTATNDAGQLQFPSTEYIQPVDVDYRQQQSRLAQQAQQRQVQMQPMAQYGPQVGRQMAASGSHGRGQGLGPMQMELQASPAQAQGQSQPQQVWAAEGGGAAAKDAAQG